LKRERLLMKQNKKNDWFFILMLISILGFTSSITMIIHAQELSLEEVLNWGIEHNSSIKEIKANIEDIERSLDLIETEYGFKTKISANPIIVGSSNKQTYDTNAESADGSKISLKTTKLFSNGIIIQSEMSLKEEDWFNLEKLSEGPKGTFSATKTIYPTIPIETEQNKMLTFNNLLKAQKALKWQQESKKIDFLESYLNLLRLQEKLSLAQANFRYAQDDLNKILKKIEIGEAGKREEIEARIVLKTAEINLLQAQNNFNQQKDSWYLDLNLPEGTEIPLREDSPFLEEIKNWVESLELNLENQGKLMDLVIANHYQIENNLLDQENAQRELEWYLAKNKPQINLYGAYSNENNAWGIGIDLSYDISDGGKRKVEEEGYRAKLENLKDEYLQIVSGLRLELSNLINQQEIYNLNLEEKLMSWEKAKLEEESYRVQLQRGLLSDSEFQHKLLSCKEAEIDFKSAEDKVLINKLRIAQFLGIRK